MVAREPVANADLLVEKFKITAFSVDIGSKKYRLSAQAEKWNGRIRIELIEAESWHENFVRQLASELEKLTGIDAQIMQGARNVEKANVTVRYMEQHDIKAYLMRRNVSETVASEVSRSICHVFVTDKARTITKAEVVIPYRISVRETKRCFIEEISQMLGLHADSELVVPSVFSNLQREIDFLPINDKILIRTLYDPAIKPGMSREATMEIARELIPKLVRDVRRRGVEALYQR